MFYVRYHGKASPVSPELYVVVDSRTNDVVSTPEPYHHALTQADYRNKVAQLEVSGVWLDLGSTAAP